MLKRDIDLFVINWYSLTSQKMIFFQGGKIFIVKIVKLLWASPSEAEREREWEKKGI